MSTAANTASYTKRIARRYGVGRALTFWRAVRGEPEAMQHWVQFVTSHWPEAAIDGMLMRPLRPYMRQHFSSAERRDLLRNHYETMLQQFGANEQLRQSPGVMVTKLVGKNDAAYTVYVGASTSKEGEMAFVIYDDQMRYLAWLAAAIGRDEQEKPVLWIGALQGAKPPIGRDEVVKATRDLYGLRPKGAVLLAAQCFAQMLGLTAIRAPGNEGHISQRGLSFLKLNKRTIHADYGQFWEELGGTKLSGDEYTIPVVPQVRDVNEVKPNKRSEWKKRQSLSEQLATDMTATLSALKIVQ